MVLRLRLPTTTTIIIPRRIITTMRRGPATLHL
jgi:hypothetical protein